MRNFPKIKGNQVVVVSADIFTGHVLDDLGNIVIGDSQKKYTIFESSTDAIHFIENAMRQNSKIEFVIYRANEEVLQHIRPSN